MPTNAGSMFLGSDNDFSASRLLISPQFDCSGEMERNPSLLRRSPRKTSTAAIPTCKFHRKRRRRSASNGSPRLVPGDGEGRCCGRGKAFCEGVGHAASKVYLMTGLAFTLLRYLGLGYRWITQVLALGCYGLLVSPGIFQVAFYYFSSKKIRRGIVYGDQPRNTLDLYLPKNTDGLKPVVAFVTGGAWIIGHKAWGCLIGQQLSERGIIVACIDYRNFPQGTISDMVEDASQGISFVCNHISEYGGDPNRIHIMGQSAGAHISSCVLLKQAIKEAGEGEKTSWSVSQIKSYLGLSGVYNLFNLVDHLHSRGLYHSIFLSIMEGEHSLQRFSPEVMVQDPNSRNAVTFLPPITLFHGTDDYSIPSDESKNFADTLQKLGVKAKSVLYEGRTHTDLFLQDPMRGGKDELFEDLVNHIHAGNSEALSNHAKAAPRRRLVPEIMLRIASRISPF